ncbi:protein of unknown function [Agrobacterium pusense]|uniref:Uncharacterized protein n=1 Tax=Agrobacterium pusense TaxID=648995 RepID=U4Q6U0_9HYPH|nr:protein of unknown function [Agrobacterium pusense]
MINALRSPKFYPFDKIIVFGLAQNLLLFSQVRRHLTQKREQQNGSWCFYPDREQWVASFRKRAAIQTEL